MTTPQGNATEIPRVAESPRGGAAEGKVFDIGYQKYDGPREGRNRARMSIYKDGIKNSLGIGRGPRAKILPWLFIGVLVLVAGVMALVAGAADRLAGEGTAAALDLPSHSDYYGIASIILFIFAAISGPELLCPDRRDGVLNLYLVRPLTGTDYIAARWASFFTVMLAVAWLPQLILLTGLAMGAPEPADYLQDNWLDIPKFLGAGAAIAAYTITLALLVAAFTTRRAYASAFLVGLFVITTPFTTGLAQEIGGTTGQWLSMFNLSNIPVHVNDIIFNQSSDVTNGAPAAELADWILISWFFGWVLGPAGILWARYRRMTP
jgi:ABC-2 type transport system permease protein